MSDKDNADFKVVDRRSSRTDEEREKQRAGDGFVMKDTPPAEAAAPEKVDFATLVFSFATSALINMGLAPDPSTQKVHKDLHLAKQNIDILELLNEKTKGNLTDDEGKLLESLLAETRLRFVEASKS